MKQQIGTRMCLILTLTVVLLTGCKLQQTDHQGINDREYVMKAAANFTDLLNLIQDCSLSAIKQIILAKEAQNMFLIGEVSGLIEIGEIASENEIVTASLWLKELVTKPCDNTRYEIEKIEFLIGRDMYAVGLDGFGRREFEVFCKADGPGPCQLVKVYKHRCLEDELLQLRPNEPLVKFKKVTISQYR